VQVNCGLGVKFPNEEGQPCGTSDALIALGHFLPVLIIQHCSLYLALMHPI